MADSLDRHITGNYGEDQFKGEKMSHSESNGKPKVKVEVDGKYLRIKIPLQKAEGSKSGKTMVVATTHGNRETEAEIDGKKIFLGLNAYYYAKEK